LSDGTIRFIALAVLFLQHSLPTTIIIDEPELGLHPFAISRLASLIQAAASNSCQVIVATQSVDQISHFQPENIISVDNKNGNSEFSRLELETYTGWLEDYTLDELWKRNIINHAQPNYQ
jgi:predicted ATPase